MREKKTRTKEESEKLYRRTTLIFDIVGISLLAVLIILFIVGFSLHPSYPLNPTEQTPVVTSVVEETESATEAPTEPSIPATEPEYTEPTEPETTAPTEPKTEPEPTEPEYSVEEPETELEMLACVIYQEAGGNGSCDKCRRYVGDVVLNRVNDPRFPDTMYEVLTAPSQYGRFHWTGIVWPSRAKYEPEAVKRAYEAAEELLSGEHTEIYGENYVFQAEFKQGRGGFWCCGTYFGWK